MFCCLKKVFPWTVVVSCLNQHPFLTFCLSGSRCVPAYVIPSHCPYAVFDRHTYTVCDRHTNTVFDKDTLCLTGILTLCLTGILTLCLTDILTLCLTGILLLCHSGGLHSSLHLGPEGVTGGGEVHPRWNTGHHPSCLGGVQVRCCPSWRCSGKVLLLPLLEVFRLSVAPLGSV